MGRTVLLRTDDGHEALYVDGLLMQISKPVCDGADRVQWFMDASLKYDFRVENMAIWELSEKDNEAVVTSGDFPPEIGSLTDTYPTNK